MSDFKINKNKLPPELLKNLQGFEEVFEQFLQEEAKKDSEYLQKENDKINEQYELTKFLEDESKRVRLLNDFFAKKIPLKVTNNQTEILFQIQQQKKLIEKEKLISKLLESDSPLLTNLANMIDNNLSASGH